MRNARVTCLAMLVVFSLLSATAIAHPIAPLPQQKGINLTGSAGGPQNQSSNGSGVSHMPLPAPALAIIGNHGSVNYTRYAEIGHIISSYGGSGGAMAEGVQPTEAGGAGTPGPIMLGYANMSNLSSMTPGQMAATANALSAFYRNGPVGSPYIFNETVEAPYGQVSQNGNYPKAGERLNYIAYSGGIVTYYNVSIVKAVPNLSIGIDGSEVSAPNSTAVIHVPVPAGSGAHTVSLNLQSRLYGNNVAPYRYTVRLANGTSYTEAFNASAVNRSLPIDVAGGGNATITFDTGGNGNYSAVDPTVVIVPTTITGYVPITITNSQPSATSAPFQQMITVDSQSYSAYEAGNLDNIEFFYSNSVVVPSWMEGSASNVLLDSPANASGMYTSTNTIYWIQIAGGIPGGGNVVVYMGFAPKSDNLFANSMDVGEAPEMSPSYAEYDDGKAVFSTYDNFSGTHLSAIWHNAVKNAYGKVTVNNGATFAATRSSGYVFLPTASKGIYPQVIEMLYDPAGTATAGIYPTIGEATGLSKSSWVDLCPGYEYDWGAGSPNSGETVEEPSGCSYSVSSAMPMPVSDSVVGFAWNATGYETAYDNYTALGTSNFNNLTIANYYPYLGLSNYQSGSFTAQWARARAYPPEGVMPGYGVGQIVGISRFAETGLPNSGEAWAVIYNGVESNAVAPNDIVFGQPPGNYPFSPQNVVIGANVYVPSPVSGTLVTGNSTSVSFSAASICTVSLNTGAIDFGQISPKSQTYTINSIIDTDSGSAPSYMYVSGSDWFMGGTDSFGAGNTVWAGASGTSYAAANALTQSPANTLVYLTAGGSNGIYFGVGIPAGASGGSYTQNIIIENFC